jgi:hypothetical protein
MDAEPQVAEIAKQWRLRHKGKPTVKISFTGKWSVTVNQYGVPDRCKVWGNSDDSLEDAMQSFWDALERIKMVCDCNINGQPENPFVERRTR